jgi:hypothetical protein
VCNVGFAHCSSNPLFGCETSILTDTRNCGLDPASACGNSCDALVVGKPAVANSACINGTCEIGSCQPGYQDCDRAVANGCECPPGSTCDAATGACGVLDAGTD